jgi:hypothetical protein
MSTRITLTAPLLAALFPAAARAQFQIDWYTIDGGGGSSAGGSFALTGTIGQPDAGAAAGGGFECGGGFWGGSLGSALCYANCDGSTAAPVLNVNDFICFQQKYAAGDAYANCDNSTTVPILNINDFICFQQKFAAGCF